MDWQSSRPRCGFAAIWLEWQMNGQVNQPSYAVRYRFNGENPLEKERSGKWWRKGDCYRGISLLATSGCCSVTMLLCTFCLSHSATLAALFLLTSIEHCTRLLPGSFVTQHLNPIIGFWMVSGPLPIRSSPSAMVPLTGDGRSSYSLLRDFVSKSRPQHGAHAHRP